MAKTHCLRRSTIDAKGGLEAEIARLERLHAAHVDDQHAIRRQQFVMLPRTSRFRRGRVERTKTQGH